MAIPLPYHDMLFTDLDREPFERRYYPLYGPLLRSLTVTIDTVQRTKSGIDDQDSDRYGTMGVRTFE